MKLFQIIPAAVIITLTSCGSTPQTTVPEEIVIEDSLAVETPVEAPVLPVADSVLTAYAQFYSGVAKADFITLTDKQQQAWNKYSKEVKTQLTASYKKMAVLDTLSRTDFEDINKTTETVFYPFGGPDLFYPLHIFPDADNYILTGLEPTGSILNKVIGTGLDYKPFISSQRNFLINGYFITIQMHEDLHGVQIDGTTPLYTMQLGAMGYSIESAGYKVLDANGELRDTTVATNIIQLKVFKEGDTKSKTITYYKGRLEDKSISQDFVNFMAKLDPATTSGFIKAASYLLVDSTFSVMRNNVLAHTHAVVQDDTGIPYRVYLKEGWDVTLYGTYMHPLNCFSEHNNQPDLANAFKELGSRDLPIRLGYNSVSNLLVCRKNNNQ